jgi:TRAP-type C4-dicarboxylate transport system permease small subunit
VTNEVPPHASERPESRFLTLERVLAALSMAGLCFISFGNVVARYTTNYSFAFTEEYSVFLMVLMTFVGASIAVARGGHMRIGFIADLGTRWRNASLALATAASLGMFGLIVWYGARLAWDQYRFEELSAGLGHPTWIYTVWMPLFTVIICVRIALVWSRRRRIEQ